MKKQINPKIKAHLIRSAFYVLLLLAVCVIPFALAQRNSPKASKPTAARPNSTATVDKAKLAAARAQTGASFSHPRQVAQPKTAGAHAQLPYDVRSLPPQAAKFPYSSIRDRGTSSTSKPTGTAKRVSQAPLKSGGPTGTHTFRILPQPKAPKVVLYDQYDNAGGNSTVSQNFEPANDPFDSFTADDFVVPGGETWNIQEVDALGLYFNGAGPADSFNVFIYEDSATFPGTLVYSATDLAYTTADNLNFVIPLTLPATLTEGTYWVSVQANLDFSVGGEWGWTDRTVQAFSGAAFENPGGGFACPGGNGWVRKPDCVPTTDPDQVYRLVGTTGGGGTPTPTPTPSPTPTCIPGAGGLLVGSGMTTGFPFHPVPWPPILAGNTVNYTFSNSQAAPNEFALFETHDPWGSTVVKDAITGNGHTYTEFTPADLAGFDFSQYRVVILNWDDSFLTDFNAQYSAAIPALEAYVNAGGVVWVQAAIQGSPGDNYPMPFGGQGNGADFGDSDPVVDPASPMMTGMPNPIEGTSASHVSYSGLPGAAHVVVINGADSQPTLYELRPGGGGCTPTPSPSPTATPSCTPIVVTGSIDTGDPTQTDRLFRSGIPQTCPASTTCAIFGDGLPRHYDEYTFTNTTGATQCVTVDTNTACTFIFTGAYLGSFDPPNICTNWIGDSGSSPNPEQAFQFDLDDGQTVVIVVSEVDPDAGCAGYTVTISGLCGGGATPTPSPTPGGSCPPVITQSTSTTIESGDSVACNNGFETTENHYWRAFDMGTFTGGQEYDVTSVDFGVELAISGGIQLNSVTVNIYANHGAPFPGGDWQSNLVGTSGPVDIPDQQLTFPVNIPITANVATGTLELVLEVIGADGQGLGNEIFIGANSATETGLSYVSAADCGLTVPTPTGDIGFPNTHWVFNVNGTCPGGTPTPTPSATATATATATVPPVTPTPTATATATATATTPPASPTPTPSATRPPPTPRPRPTPYPRPTP